MDSRDIANETTLCEQEAPETGPLLLLVFILPKCPATGLARPRSEPTGAWWTL
jgi:hypothetical protein